MLTRRKREGSRETLARLPVGGYIEKVLPVTEALPPEFQLPNRLRGRGQLVRIELSELNNFAIDQKVEVTTCYFDKCGGPMSGMIKAMTPGEDPFELAKYRSKGKTSG